MKREFAIGVQWSTALAALLAEVMSHPLSLVPLVAGRISTVKGKLHRLGKHKESETTSKEASSDSIDWKTAFNADRSPLSDGERAIARLIQCYGPFVDQGILNLVLSDAVLVLDKSTGMKSPPFSPAAVELFSWAQAQADEAAKRLKEKEKEKEEKEKADAN